MPLNWSGPEFEEHLRNDTTDLVKRFVEGEVLPELPAEMAAFAATSGSLSDACRPADELGREVIPVSSAGRLTPQ